MIQPTNLKGSGKPHAVIVKNNQDLLGWALIISSSILLSIWAVSGTVALRNLLLVFGAIVSLIYCAIFFKNTPPKIPLKNWIPLILLGFVFCWVVTHYLFLTRFPQQQLHELTSTWLRCSLGTIMALGTGLAIAKYPAAINCLWLGILASFCYLFYQYIPKAIAAHSFFAIDYNYYIYRLKMNGVLSSTIMVAGLLGTFLDTIQRSLLREKLIVGLLWLFGTLASLFASVFIFDSRNGVGLVIIMFSAVFPYVALTFLRTLFGKADRKGALAMLLLIACTIMIMFWFGLQQIRHNSGWASTWEDAVTAVQVEKYHNWQNLPALGYPQNASGQIVKSNTYERVAWATAGLTIFLPQNPLGVGLLSKSFNTLVKESYPNSSSIPATHSAWIDFALAFGYPGVLLLVITLLSTIYLAINSKSYFRNLVNLMSVSLILLFTVGELASQHSIEMSFFLISLDAVLLFPIYLSATMSNSVAIPNPTT